ncbi:MAG: hypothetical protein KDA85_06535 [Planctomycetaceae bacterium]|nr:hypothetical protein [Planctomycetaceae bacterium]
MWKLLTCLSFLGVLCGSGCEQQSDDYVAYEDTAPVAEAVAADNNIEDVPREGNASAAPATADQSTSSNMTDTATDSGGDAAVAANSEDTSADMSGSGSPSTSATDQATEPKTSVDLVSSGEGAGRDLPFQDVPRIGADGNRVLPEEYAEDVVEEILPIKLLVSDKTFRQERGSSALRVSYDDIDLLKVLNMQPVPPDADDHFPQWLSDLEGKTVRIRGFMYPTFESEGLTGFTMARDNGICCFVRKPKIYDIIRVRLDDGETTEYIANRPFDVEGVFHIVPEADGDELFGLYRIDQARIVH